MMDFSLSGQSLDIREEQDSFGYSDVEHMGRGHLILQALIG